MADIHSLGIQGVILSASSGDEYKNALHRNSDLSVLEPKYIVFPTTFSDIPPVLSYVTSQSPALEVAVKGGGCHTSTSSSSAGGIVIDLAKLNKAVVSEDKQSITVQGGAVWGDVYEACQKSSVDVVGGNVWFVGVGGYLTGGGYSHLTGKRGLAIDNIVSATVILSDGQIVKTSAREEPDLFWAIRGGSNQFGIVVEFVLKTFPASGPATVGALVYPGTDIANVVKVTQEWLTTYTAQERVILTFARAPPNFYPSVLIMPYVSGDPKHADTVLAPFRSSPLKPVADFCASVPDLLAVSHSADATFARAPRRVTIGGAVFSEAWSDMLFEVWARWCKFTEDNEDARESMVMWEFYRSEKIAQVGKAETAFHIREPHYYAVVQGRHHSPASDAISRAFVSSTTAYIQQVQREKTGKDLGTLVGFAQGQEKVEDVYGANYPRLRKLKAKYDPKCVWSKGFAIKPDFA